MQVAFYSTRKALYSESCYSNFEVYSSDLIWEPQGDQDSSFEEQIAPVHSDIPIAELARGQVVVCLVQYNILKEIECQCYAHKGIGKDHAKFSPVATAYYRLMPNIRFKTQITGEHADKLVKQCPMGVFDIEEGGTNPQKTDYLPKNNSCRGYKSTFVHHVP